MENPKIIFYLIMISIISFLSCNKNDSNSQKYNEEYYNTGTLQSYDLEYNFKIPEARKLYEEGRRFYVEKDFVNAINSYKKSLQIEKMSGTYNELGITYRTIYDFTNCINTYLKGINEFGNAWSIYFNLANVYAKTGDYENSKKYLELIINKTDSDFWKEYSYLHLAGIYYNDHNVTKAKEYISKIKNLQNNSEISPLFYKIKNRIESY